MDHTLDRTEVDRWLAQLLARLKDAFGERLVFVGCHGSWARGEAGPDSDIDTLVILDRVDPKDLSAYRDLMHAMPQAERLASGGIWSVSELRAHRPRSELIQFYYGCKTLHGTLHGLVERPTEEDFIEDIQLKACAGLFLARHYLLFPHDLREKVHRLRDPFKYCFFGLQSWMLWRTRKYFARKDDLITVLPDPEDQEVVRIARDWHRLSEDRTARPLYYMELLERWSRRMLSRLETLQTECPKRLTSDL